jgi:hypothetical protein
MTLKIRKKIVLTLPITSNLSDIELKDVHFKKKYGDCLPSFRSSGKTNIRFVTYGRGKRFFGLRYVCYGCDTLFMTEGWVYRTKREIAYICPKCKPLIVNLADVDLLNIASQGGKVNRR